MEGDAGALQGLNGEGLEGENWGRAGRIPVSKPTAAHAGSLMGTRSRLASRCTCMAPADSGTH